MSATTGSNPQERFETEGEVAYVHDHGDRYSVIDSSEIEDANYSLSLITSENNISPEAKLISLILDNHSENYLPEMNTPEQIQIGRQLIEKDILDEDYNINPELPDQMLKYAQAATISEQTDNVALEDIGVDIDESEPETGRETQWFEDYGQDLVRKIDEMDKPVANSRLIAEDIDANTRQVGLGISEIQNAAEDDYVYSQHSKSNNWDIKKMQEDLDLEEVAEKGLEAI